MTKISQYIQHIQEEFKDIKGVLQALAVTIGKYVQESMASIIKGMSKSHGKASKYVYDIQDACGDRNLNSDEHTDTASDRRGYFNKDDVATLKMQHDLEKQLMNLLDCVKKIEEIIPALMSEANPDTAKEIKDINQLLNEWRDAVEKLEQEEAERKRHEEQKRKDEKNVKNEKKLKGDERKKKRKE
ncbi:unnamed protein product [Mytilus coruscus]|uniref:Uncharacterized protein n=1 Tax=Mytilus coruscus TaxID=42192 RepID=A0A6J8BDS5_MYTCO|nr:unnamed protein product [Mytilus coruscus]